MRKKSLRRIFTAIFSAVFVFSTVMCTVPAFAGSGDKTDLVTVSNSDAQTVDYNSTEKNVLKKKNLIFLTTLHRTQQRRATIG